MNYFQSINFFGQNITIKASDKYLEEICLSQTAINDHPNKITEKTVAFLQDYEVGIFTRFDYSLIRDFNDYSKKARVYRELVQVQPGQTISYTQLALKAQLPGAHRFVGTCMRTNPIPIIVPCHRVLKNDFGIGQYSFGGASFKKKLLDHEKSSFGI